jgi:hypothetical protein
MTAETLPPPLSILDGLDTASTVARVRVEGDRVLVDRLLVQDPALAAFVAERPADDRPELVGRALRIGLLAIQDTAVTLNVDVVRAEFEKLMRQAESANDKAAQALEQTLRANFADGDGRLPRTLERFLGDRGALRSMVEELFDPTRRDSAIGRIGTMLERYFDGDASKLAVLLDPTRLNSPLHQFRQEMTAGFKSIEERLVAIEAAAAARGAERARSAAKGGDFEDLLEAMLGDLARGAGDLLDRTGTETGAVLKSKKGDFVLTLDPRVARGADVRVVIEAKDRPMSMRAIRDELREARENRCAAGAVASSRRPTPRPVSRRSASSATTFTASSIPMTRSRPPSRPPSGSPGCCALRHSSSTRSRSIRRAIGGRPDRHPRAARGRPDAQVASSRRSRTPPRRSGRVSTRCARPSCPRSPRPKSRDRRTGRKGARTTPDRSAPTALSGPRGRRRTRCTDALSEMHRRIAPLLLAVLVAIPIVGSVNAAEPAIPPSTSPRASDPEPTPAPIRPRRPNRPRAGRDARRSTQADPPTTRTSRRPFPRRRRWPLRRARRTPVDRWIVHAQERRGHNGVVAKAGKRDNVNADHRSVARFRGFSAKLDTAAQADLLADPNVAAVVPTVSSS